MVGIGGDAEQAERAEFRPQMRGELVRAVDVGGERRDPVLREAAHHVAQRLDVLAKREVKRVRVHFFPPWRALLRPGALSWQDRFR